jgi:hypothetical protein
MLVTNESEAELLRPAHQKPVADAKRGRTDNAGLELAPFITNDL